MLYLAEIFQRGIVGVVVIWALRRASFFAGKHCNSSGPIRIDTDLILGFQGPRKVCRNLFRIVFTPSLLSSLSVHLLHILCYCLWPDTVLKPEVYREAVWPRFIIQSKL